MPTPHPADTATGRGGATDHRDPLDYERRPLSDESAIIPANTAGVRGGSAALGLGRRPLADKWAFIPTNTVAVHGGGAASGPELAENSALTPANTTALHGGGADELAENSALIPAPRSLKAAPLRVMSANSRFLSTLDIRVLWHTDGIQK